MSKPGTRSIAASVVVLTSAAIAVLASAGGAQGPGERTFTVTEKDEHVALVDLPPRSPDRRNPRISPGDLDVFTTKLFDASGRRVGRTDAHCIAVRAGRSFDRARFHCNGTATFRDGTIAVSVAFGDGQAEEDVRLAITGGTGAYEGARGSVSSRHISGGRIENTFHLLS
jgi:Allene oxide cyclase